MIIVKIMGGLGNQMFQYALARSLKQLGKKVKMDISYYDKIPESDARRVYELDKFDCTVEKAAKHEIKLYDNKLRLIYDKLVEKIPVLHPVCIAEHGNYIGLDISKIANNYLLGYWQSEKYFSAIREILLQEFNFSKLRLSSENEKVRDLILKSGNAVSIHVRGGDYLDSENFKIYGNICTDTYYANACEYMNGHVNGAVFFLFTNDLHWVKTELSICKEYPVYVIDSNDESNGITDLYLMSICKHNIIANSSFSWWGAWLNRNAEKIVIAPDRWQNGQDNKDIYCKDWIKINNY